MDARTRRTVEMGTRSLEFSHAHPHTSAGYAAALARLQDRLDRAEVLAAQQMEGLRTVRVATARKLELSKLLRGAHLAHVSQVGKVAAREVPELERTFEFRPGTRAYLAFRTAARGMMAEAESHKEVMVRHGLDESVLEGLRVGLDQFDAAVDQGLAGRQAHVGASAELFAVAEEIVQIVRVMDGLNRTRFLNDAEALARWESASNLPARRGSSNGKPAAEVTPPEGGEARPAA